MFRRIEQIREFAYHPGGDEDTQRYFRTGLCGLTTDEIANAWEGLPAPKCAIPNNCRFYFTEAGWKKYGRKVVTACQVSEKKYGVRYRVIAIKENAVDVVYRDEWQVAGQPIRKWRKDGFRRNKEGK